MSNKSPWKTISSKYVYENPWIKVRHDQVIKPDGTPGIYGVVEGADFVCIIPKIGDTFYLVDQFRYTQGTRSTEFPQGSIEKGETVEEAVQRELKEELGMVVKSMKEIGFLQLGNGVCKAGSHIFIVEGASIEERQLEGAESDMVTKKMSLEELKRLVKNGTIVDESTVAAFAMYLLEEESKS